MDGQGTDVVKIDDYAVPIEPRLYELENQLMRGGLVSEPMEAFYLVSEARQELELRQFHRQLGRILWFSVGFAACGLTTVFSTVVSW